ncbi:Uncharacterised protein [Legionella busanensis]|uniref:HTH cro/C1-type domain-containing protein n=1 Tax=Legionella busanensis TaxID=190655 RepID=A0A378JJT6_9GAMM|nr:hypothetical protein [Legionella busanensis]STX50958.1 Uncharacterised protein [Legionella busanensis]
MGSLVKLLTSTDQTVQYKKEAQKYLIEFILFQGNYDLIALAELLDVSPFYLNQVASGKATFEEEVANKLFKWFLVIISD